MTPIRWSPVDTPDGPMLAAVTERGIAALSASSDVDSFLSALRQRFPLAELDADADALVPVARWLAAFLDGARHDLPEVDLGGLRPFDASVYRAVRAIPAGQTATYGDVAATIGAPRAARAVGGAMSRCSLFPAVPCHRVVRADGIGGWGGDPRRKRRLLALEAQRS